ncbi:MAG: HAMP domain-containing sensor histidine kinase [Promethearchaeia archaeon]
MNLISIIDISSFITIIIGMLIVIFKSSKKIPANMTRIILLLLILNSIHHLFNFIEWAIYPVIDFYDDFIEILQPIIWMFVFYEFIQEESKKELMKSKQRYIEAYNRVEFFKDLLAHDMANILQNINSSIEMIELQDIEGTISEKSNEMMDIMKNQITKGSSLISRVRKLSKVEKEVKDKSLVDIEKILNEIIKHIHSRVREKKIIIEKEFDSITDKVMGGDLLLHAFENILLNGCVHNDSEPIKLWVILSEVQENGETFVKIEFKDNGIGVSDETKESIFERNYKKNRNMTGMGIGLSLVKKIVNGYGGQIQVENRVKGDYTQGSNFIVTLPTVS